MSSSSYIRSQTGMWVPERKADQNVPAPHPLQTFSGWVLGPMVWFVWVCLGLPGSLRAFTAELLPVYHGRPVRAGSASARPVARARTSGRGTLVASGFGSHSPRETHQKPPV